MLKDMTVVVTGGAKGIGKAIALEFAKNGANVVINYRSTSPDDVVKEISAFGVKCIAVKADVSVFEEAKTLVTKAKEEFGSVDILVNNAGITKDTLLLRMKESEFDDVINVNLKGTFNTIQNAVGIMLKQKSGTIINMSSVIGQIGNAGQANYAASKAGIIGLTKSVAREVGPRGITCNAIAPGFIETEMTDMLPEKVKESVMSNIPLKKFGSVQDVAKVAVFLAENKYITGQVINVDGGMVMY